AIATQSDSAKATCPFHSKPAKQKQQSSQAQCCKTLRAVVLAQSKSWARDRADFSNVDFYAEERTLIVCSLRTPAPLLLDTGPPSTLVVSIITNMSRKKRRSRNTPAQCIRKS